MKRLLCRQIVILFAVTSTLVSCATRDSGYKISDETVAFVQPGVTARTELIENLGPPLLELKSPRVVAYSWGRIHLTGARSGVRDDPMQGRAMGSTVGLTPTEEI